MKRSTTLLSALLIALMATSAVQAGPFLFLDQLFGSAESLSADQIRMNQNQNVSERHQTDQHAQDGGDDGGQNRGEQPSQTQRQHGH